MPLRIAITGTRDLDHERSGRLEVVFDRYLLPFCSDGTDWYLGGAAGIDTAALLWLAANPHAGRLTVSVPARFGDQPDNARRAIKVAERSGRLSQLVELNYPGGVNTDAFDIRNRWLVDHSNCVIGFPLSENDDGSGTWATLNYARLVDRPIVIVRF